MPDLTPPPAQSSAQALVEKKVHEQKWPEENRAAMEDYNERIERDGLTFAAFLDS